MKKMLKAFASVAAFAMLFGFAACSDGSSGGGNSGGQVAVTSIEIDGPSALAVNNEEGIVLTATVLPENATNSAVNWKSSRTIVTLTAGENNTVTVKPNSLTKSDQILRITAEAKDGSDVKSEAFEIYISAAPKTAEDAGIDTETAQKVATALEKLTETKVEVDEETGATTVTLKIDGKDVALNVAEDGTVTASDSSDEDAVAIADALVAAAGYPIEGLDKLNEVTNKINAAMTEEKVTVEELPDSDLKQALTTVIHNHLNNETCVVTPDTTNYSGSVDVSFGTRFEITVAEDGTASVKTADTEIEGALSDAMVVILNSEEMASIEVPVSGFESYTQYRKEITDGLKEAKEAKEEYENSIIEIEITSEPTKKLFTEGDDPDWTGLVVEATYGKGTKETLTAEDYTVIGFDSSVVAESQTITVTVGVLTKTFTITIQEKPKAIMNGVKYDTIKAAIAAIPTSGDTGTYTINLTKGTYNEIGLAYNGSATIKISGDTTAKYGADVVIKGHGSDMTTEKTRNLIEIQGTGDIILENLTLESDWSRADHSGDVQSEVLGTDTKGNTIAYNCAFKSHQDTLRTAGKAWFYGCYIEGDVDFMWMEEAGSVALYEKCEIVSLYDAKASTHNTYLTAPRMAISSKVGKGLVIFNSTVKESEAAAANGQLTYLARTPWSSGYYNQVAFINTPCTGVETSPWYKTQIATNYAKTVIGWKMDKTTADSIGYAGNNDIVDADTVSKEFNGRRSILNRIYNTGKGKYEKDVVNNWDIDAVIDENEWTVDEDSSSDVLEGESTVEPTIYKFDGSVDQSALCEGFALETGKTHYKGAAGNTITIPVTGKSYVEVYGYYSGTVEVKADTQGEAVMFFNNGTTNSELADTYIVYDENATSVVITAKAATYITKVIVSPDASIAQKSVTAIEISRSGKLDCVGVGLTLKAAVTPTDATNKSVKWSSSDEAVGKIDTYTGKVTFVAAGDVTFTATACDGSNVTKTIDCSPIAPTWTECEWYTTDQKLDEEEGATEIGNFNPNGSAYKALSSAVTYTNLAGTSFTTSNGLKLNGSGVLTIATTKSNATLTLVIAPAGKETEAPKVTDGTNTPTASAPVTQGSLTIYTYKLAVAGTYDITRAGGSEVNPIVYAKCEYPTAISETTGYNFKGGAYSGTNLKNVNSDDTIRLDGTKTTYELVTFEGVSSNGADNWGTTAAGSTAKFKVAGACKLNLYFYNGQTNGATVTCGSAAPVTLTDEASPTYKTAYTVDITSACEVTITFGGGYIGMFEVVFAN